MKIDSQSSMDTIGGTHTFPPASPLFPFSFLKQHVLLPAYILVSSHYLVNFPARVETHLAVLILFFVLHMQSARLKTSTVWAWLIDWQDLIAWCAEIHAKSARTSTSTTRWRKWHAYLSGPSQSSGHRKYTLAFQHLFQSTFSRRRLEVFDIRVIWNAL